MINKKELLKKYIDKMPLAKEYINSIEEDIQSFRVRKIKWAIKELFDNNRNLNVTNVKKLLCFKKSTFEE